MSEQENREVKLELTKAQIQSEIKKAKAQLKNKLKSRSKSQLIDIIWDQGLQFKQIQEIAQELYEELVELKKKLPQEELYDAPEGEENA